MSVPNNLTHIIFNPDGIWKYQDNKLSLLDWIDAKHDERYFKSVSEYLVRVLCARQMHMFKDVKILVTDKRMDEYSFEGMTYNAANE